MVTPGNPRPNFLRVEIRVPTPDPTRPDTTPPDSTRNGSNQNAQNGDVADENRRGTTAAAQMTEAQLLDSKRTYWAGRGINYDEERQFIDGTDSEIGWADSLAERNEEGDAPQLVSAGSSADFPSAATDDDIPF
jgi:hypothetical protein